MHHIATIIYPNAPAPELDDLRELILSEFEDAEVVEVDDGFELTLEGGTLFLEVQLPEESLDDLDEDDEDDEDDGLEGLEELDEDDEREVVDLNLEEESDDERDPYAAAAMILHLEGDFDDPAEVIGVLEVLLSAGVGAMAVDGEGEPLLVD